MEAVPQVRNANKPASRRKVRPLTVEAQKREHISLR